MKRTFSPPTQEDLGIGVLFGSIRDAVIVGDAESGRIVLWNPAAESLFGYSRTDAVGMLMEDLVPERLREAHRAGLARYAAGASGPLINAPHPIEVPALRRNGAEIAIELTLNPLEETRVPGRFVLALVRDATARQRLERERSELLMAAQASEERFRAAFDQAAIGMSLARLDGRFLRVNAALCALTGYAERELLTMTFQDITHPDDRAVDLVEVNRLRAGELPAFKREKRYLRKDGTVIWIRLNASLVRDEYGMPLHFIGQVEDITDRKVVEVERNRLHTELEAEFARAAEIQAQLLPHEAPDLPGYEFAGTCLPARQVGGDFYDWLAGDDAIRLSLGDVMGKGMPASILTATVRAALRTVEDLPVSAAVEAVNRALSSDLMHTDSFVTLFHAALEPATGELTYVDAGHGLDFIQRRDGTVEPLRQHGLPLGILPNATYPAGTIILQPGDTLVIYSDGLPDARPELRLDPVGVGAQIGGLPNAQAKLEHLVSLVSNIQTRPDDLTLVLLHRREEDVVLSAPLVVDHPARAGVA